MSLILSNSPLREFLVGLSLNLTDDQLDQLEKSKIVETVYPIKKPVFGISFNELNRSARQTLGGYTFFSRDGKQTVFLDKSRITLSNRDKYKGFDTFIAPFVELVTKISAIIGNFAPGADVGLRYVNEMILTPAELKLFKIVLIAQDKPVDNYGAGFRINNNNSFANITIQKDTLPEGLYRIIFDIDTHTRLTEIDANLKTLRELKNKVFFDNIEESLTKKWE